MVELHLACLDSYFAHENTYDLLVTTNDERPLEVFSAYKEKSKHRFELRLVSRDESALDLLHRREPPDGHSLYENGLLEVLSILNRECDAIVHVDYDTIFVSKVDLRPLLVSDVGLVDAINSAAMRGFGVRPAGKPISSASVNPWNLFQSWINSGVFSVQRGGFDICRNEIGHYLENLERAIADGLNASTDEIIMNALAVRERDAVTVIPDYRYNFLAYYLKHDPSWTWRGQIVHFHSLKPDTYWYFNGAVGHRCDASQAELLSEDFYLAVLMWFRHLHAACRQLAYEFPVLAAMPLEVVEKELARLVAERDACAG